VKRRTCTHVLAALLIICLLHVLGWGSVQTADAASSGPPTVAVSLRILQERLIGIPRGGKIPEDIATFGGMTEICGYMIDEEKRDIILLGRADPSKPPLFFDDFVIALRNAWNEYAERSQNTIIYSFPGCSIDPSPKVLAKLTSIVSDVNNGDDPGSINRQITEWHKTCRENQTVRVMGVPRETRFAGIMVQADYDMKGIADGSDSLEIPGFSGLMDLRIESARRSLKQTGQIEVAPASLNRFWFFPGEVVYEAIPEFALIEKCPVELLTEEEHVTKVGTTIGTGHADPLAAEFARNLTRMYSQVSKERPIYADLEGLFREVAVAKMMRHQMASSISGLDIDYLLKAHGVARYSLVDSVPGRSFVKELSYRTEDGDYVTTMTVWFKSCGGVDIRINPPQARIIRRPSKLQPLQEQIQEAIDRIRLKLDEADRGIYKDPAIPSIGVLLPDGWLPERSYAMLCSDDDRWTPLLS
jgi:hypothetical protein